MAIREALDGLNFSKQTTTTLRMVCVIMIIKAKEVIVLAEATLGIERDFVLYSKNKIFFSLQYVLSDGTCRNGICGMR